MLKRRLHRLRLKTCLFVYSFIQELIPKKYLRSARPMATQVFPEGLISHARDCAFLPRDTWPQRPRSGVFPACRVQPQFSASAPRGRKSGSGRVPPPPGREALEDPERYADEVGGRYVDEVGGPCRVGSPSRGGRPAWGAVCR